MAQVYVAKPIRVHAEQFHAATLPWPAAVCRVEAPVGVCQTAPLFADGRAHVHGGDQIYELHEGDWLTVPVAVPTALPVVVTHAQFEEIYGPQPGE